MRIRGKILFSKTYVCLLIFYANRKILKADVLFQSAFTEYIIPVVKGEVNKTIGLLNYRVLLEIHVLSSPNRVYPVLWE